MSGPIDLHAHSSVSDGTERPADLVRSAVDAGLGVIGLTDHDTTAGWDEAFEAAAGTGLTVLPGMELSTRWRGKSVHLLGYLIDPAAPALIEATRRLREERVRRARTMVERLAADYPIEWDEVFALAGPEGTVGRPHIADVLVAHGVVPHRQAAFRELLHPGTRYYLPHPAPPPLEGVRLIVESGGVPVIAHPAGRAADGVLDDEYVRKLADAGLMGVELDHRENQPEALPRWRSLADRYGLLVTGSSDYHGTGKENRLGEHTTPPEVYAAIVEHGTGSRPFQG